VDLRFCPDGVLIESAVRGDEVSFAELDRRYRSLIWRTVRRRLADPSESEDAVQEVLLRAYTSLHRFDRNRPFGHWVLRIATNYCIDVLRRRAHQAMALKVLQDPSLQSWDREPEATACFSAELARIARSLLAGLPPANRDAFILRELEDFQYADIGRALRISPVAARVRVARARKAMRRRLRPHLREHRMGPRGAGSSRGAR
jgi:RNA polymerase sigma-70 factor (ECF subfamily)